MSEPYAYYGSYEEPTALMVQSCPLNNSAPVRINFQTLNAGENLTTLAVYDDYGMIHWGLNTVPGKIVKFRSRANGLTPGRVAVITLPTVSKKRMHT